VDLGVSKLLRIGKLQQYKITLKTNSEVEKIVYEWRTYLALNLDKNPQQILHETRICQFATELVNADALDEEKIADMMSRLKVQDDYKKSARLLMYYLDADGTSLEKMSKILCINCNRQGHTVRSECFENFKKKFILHLSLNILIQGKVLSI